MKRSSISPIAVAVAAVAFLALLALVVAFGVRQTHQDEALPGTRVVGRDVAGRDAAQINRLLTPILSPARPLVLLAGARTLRLTPAQAGYSVSVAATARRAVAAGRGGILWGVPATLGGLVRDRDVAVTDTFDQRQLRVAVGGVARRLDRDPFPGGLQIDPDTRQVAIRTSRAGRRVDRDALARRIVAAVQAGDRGPVTVPFDTVKAVPSSRLREIARDAEAYLRTPLRLTVPGAGSKPYVLSPGEQARLLALEGRDGGRSARLGVSTTQLDALVGRVAAKVDRPARDARLSASARGPVSEAEKGDVRWKPVPAEVKVVAGARTGRAVAQTRLAAAVRRAVRAGDHAVTVPVVTTQPQITTAAARKVNAEIGTFTTPYIAGQPRVTNIRQMARDLDGTQIAPGEQFSLNGLAGERTREKGYVAAPFIADNKIEPSIGGGVSQFSTTMYNAAYFAGLQLDTHQPHSLYIDRYPPGREGTLNYPDIDLKWTNDTDAPVLVRTAYDDEGVTVTLYGDNGGRRVTATAGPQTPVAGGDFQITVTRTVRYPDGRVVRQPFTTRYETEDTSPQE